MIRCGTCGADLPPGHGAIVCAYCRTEHRPDTRGPVLGQADLRGPEVPGLHRTFPQNTAVGGGVLRASFPAHRATYAVLATPGPVGDVDVTVLLRFVAGKRDEARAGVEVRQAQGLGDYTFELSMQGTYRISRYDTATWHTLVPWTDHPAASSAPEGAWHELRALARGDSLRLFVNGVLAASVRDPHLQNGRVRLCCSPSGADSVFEFSELVIREAL